MQKKVLIIEDDDLNMRLFEDLLRSEGYEAIGSSHGGEAVEAARDTQPDLVVMDIHLGEDSGLDVARRLKEEADLADVPVIAVTAYAAMGAETRVRACGCADYMAKPISVPGFLKTVRRHLH